MRMKKGFTLLEVLVAIVVTLSMVGVIYGSCRGVFGTMKESKKLLSDYQTASLLLRRIGEEVTSAFVSSGLAFQGEKEGLSFWTTKNSCSSDLSGISYFLRQNEEEKIFLLRRKSLPFSETPGRAFSLAAIEQISFRYFDGEEWSFSWDSETKLPECVAIELILGENTSFSAIIPLDRKD